MPSFTLQKNFGRSFAKKTCLQPSSIIRTAKGALVKPASKFSIPNKQQFYIIINRYYIKTAIPSPAFVTRYGTKNTKKDK